MAGNQEYDSDIVSNADVNEWMKAMSYTVGTVGYAQKSDQPFLQNFVDPSKSHKPLDPTAVRITDARSIRSDLGLDTQGFMLVDHKSEFSHLGGQQAMGEAYVAEIAGVVSDIAGDADFVLPCGELMMRYSESMPLHLRQPLGRISGVKPSNDVHMDFSAKSFRRVVRETLEKAGVEQRDYRRIAVIQTWRALTDPPQDFPLALTDRRSVTPGHHVLMTSITDASGNTTETTMSLRDEKHAWYYFPNMRQDELVVFKGYDTVQEGTFNVFHAAFDDRKAQPEAIPRSSVEMRYFVFWK